MTEILSREKELFKMNQELNLMSLSPYDDNHVTQSRYGTYLKQKGPSTLLRKKNVVDMTSVKAISTRGNLRSINHKSPPKSPITASASPICPSGTSPRPGKCGISTLMSPSTKVPRTTPQSMDYRHRHWGTDTDLLPASRAKQGKQSPRRPDSSSVNRRGAAHKTATYVKYRNPNFKQSPSLDLLLQKDGEHEETAAQQEPHHQSQQKHQSQLQQQQQPQPQQHVAEVKVMQQMRPSTTVVNGQSKKQLTQENFIRFLKAKVAILEEDHEQITQDMTAQRERLEEAMDALRKAEAQRDQAVSSNSKLAEQLQRLEKQTEEANQRQKDSKQEQSNQQRELEQLRREVKMMKQMNINLENRLRHANEEAYSNRQLLEQHNADKRDEQNNNRKEIKVRDNRIKALKKQRADLLNAYKKQLFMIDNLKRQNSCVEQAVAIGFGEKEFNKVLDWNSKGNSSSKIVF